MSLRAAMLILLVTSTAAAANSSHDDEIKAFAKTMAIAKTVKESCSGIGPDDRFLEALRQRLHVVDEDQPAFAPQAKAAADILQTARDAAPSRKAWCDAVFRLYGSAGKLMPGMLQGQ